MRWYSVVSQDITKIPDAISFYEAELVNAKQECRISGNIEKAAAALPGIVEHRFGQLQEIEAILEFLNIEAKRLRSHKFRHFLETYPRALTSRDVEKYIDGEPEIIAQDLLINEFALLRNKWLGITKGVEQKHWQLSNIVKLRSVGIEDATI